MGHRVTLGFIIGKYFYSLNMNIFGFTAACKLTPRCRFIGQQRRLYSNVDVIAAP